MIKLLHRLSLFLVTIPLVSVPAQHLSNLPDFKHRFDGLQGAFVLYDLNEDVSVRYNITQCAKRYSPASTFKILNSLIGLETGVIPDEHFVIPWDGVRRDMPEWNRDHDMASAIKYSVVPYYRELARRVGQKRMQEWVRKVGYGNEAISGGIDRFWLGSSLRISADEQIDFLRKLYENKLPFSQRSLSIVKKILVRDATDAYVLHAKTGFATGPDGSAIGWYVGYIERKGNVYFFACNIVSPNAEKDGERIMKSRQEIAVTILKDLGIM